MNSLISWIIWFVLMSLIMGWLAKSRTRADAGSQSNRLHHPRSILLIGVVVGGFFLILAVLSMLSPDKGGSLGVSLIFLGFALLGAALVAEYLRVHHQLEPDGMHYRKLLGQGGRFYWSDVTRIQYSPSAKWFRIVTSQGNTIRISAMLVGLPEFAQAVLAQVRPTAIEAATRPVLEQTANGSPPSIWI